MARALELARRGLYTTDPNPRVGCVIVKQGKIIGEGWHHRAGKPHAEIEALKNYGKKRIHDATVYVTLEPCCNHGRTPPCTDALIKARPDRVVVAMEDPNPRVSGMGIRALDEAGIAVTMGLMEGEASELNAGFISRMGRGRPFVRVKLAASLDGRTALANGKSRWITGKDARLDVHRWRARASAVMTGVSTVLHDDPSLNVRDIKTDRQPLRIILDSRLRMPANAKMIQLPGKTLVVCANEDTKSAQALRRAGVEIVALSDNKKTINVNSLMKHLHTREINELHVEAGSTLCGSLMNAGLVDELVLYMAPNLLGADAKGMFRFKKLESMSDRISLNIKDVRAVGKDWRFVCQVLDSR